MIKTNQPTKNDSQKIFGLSKRLKSSDETTPAVGHQLFFFLV